MNLKTTILALALAIASPLFAQSKPTLYMDVNTNVKGPDPVAQAFLKPIVDGLTEVFDIKPGTAKKGETSFEVRVFIVNGGVDKDFVTVIVTAKPDKEESFRIYIGSDTVLVTKEHAEADGNETLKDIGGGMTAFIDAMSPSKDQ